VQKFNAQHPETRLLVYRSVPLSVPCVFWKFEAREVERLGLKIGGRGTAFPCVLWHFNHWRRLAAGRRFSNTTNRLGLRVSACDMKAASGIDAKHSLGVAHYHRGLQASAEFRELL